MKPFISRSWTRRRTLAALLLPATLLVSACDKSNDGSPKPVTLKFGHLASESHTWHQAALKFKEVVEARSAGQIEVKVYPNSQLGQEMELINSIQLGTADLTITGESL